MTLRTLTTRILRTPTTSRLVLTPRYLSTSKASLVTKYTKSHEWISVQDGIGTIGFTNQAQREFGKVASVSSPAVSSPALKGASVAFFESVTGVRDIYSPVSGQVVEINNRLDREPSLINSSPETDGWLFKIRVDNEAQLERLLDAETYQKSIHH